MAISEYEVENLFIERLGTIGYKYVELKNYTEVMLNFKTQLEEFNKEEIIKGKGVAELSIAEFDRLRTQIENKTVYESAKILRDKQVLELDNGKRIYRGRYAKNQCGIQRFKGAGMEHAQKCDGRNVHERERDGRRARPIPRNHQCGYGLQYRSGTLRLLAVGVQRVRVQRRVEKPRFLLLLEKARVGVDGRRAEEEQTQIDDGRNPRPVRQRENQRTQGRNEKNHGGGVSRSRRKTPKEQKKNGSNNEMRSYRKRKIRADQR